MSGVPTTNRKRSFLFSKRLTYFRFVYLIYKMNSWQMTKSPRILSYRGVRYARICMSKVDFINRLRGLSLRLRQQGFETNLLQKSFNKFFSRHSLIVEKYGAALREMRIAIQAWIAPSYPYTTYLLHRVVFQSYLGTCARTILFWARALFVYLFNWRVHLVRLLTS